MEKKIDLNGKLDFSPMDLTAPNTVVDEILSQLPEQTNGIVYGSIADYSGPIESYTRPAPFSGFAEALGRREEEVNIQNDLGATGQKRNRFECFLYTKSYEHYKFRLFFMEYGISNYPVKVVLEESIAYSATQSRSNYIQKCSNRDELEELLLKILTCKRTIAVMQEIIRIDQIKKAELSASSAEDDVESPRDD